MMIIASETMFSNMKLNKDEYVFYKQGHICIAKNSNFKTKERKDEILISDNLSYFRKTGETELQGETYESCREELKDSDGYFLLASINKNRVLCCRSLYRNYDVYYWKSGKEFIITTDIRMITSILQTQSINREFLSLFINSDFAASYISPVNGIMKLEGGCELHYEDDEFKVTKFVSIEKFKGNYLETMSGLLKGISKNRDVYLHYSGGLDSTMILLLLKNSNVKFEAIHHDTYSFESDSEKKHAINICKKYGVNLHIVKPSLEYYNGTCKASHPIDCSILNTSFTSDTFSYDKLDRNKALFLDGQGGDSLFVQNPSEKIGYDLFKKGKVFSAYGKLSDLSLLKNLKFSKLLYENSLNLIYKNKKNNSSHLCHTFSRHLDNRSSEFDYHNDVINMMETRPTVGFTKHTSFSPILSLSSVSNFMSFEYQKNFSDEYDRLVIRNMLYNKFSEPAVFEKKKRSSVNMIYQMIRMQKKYIANAIENSNIPELVGLDKDTLRTALEYNSSVRLNDDAYVLLRIAAAHQYYDSLNLI